MAILPIDPSFATGGAEWKVGAIDAAPQPTQNFQNVLTQALGSLGKSQDAASSAAQDLAVGKTDDTTAVVMAAERARLSMQLASQIRNKSVEALQDIFHTQV